MNAENSTEWGVNSVPLEFPVKLGDQTISEITLREPNGEALEAIDDLGLKEGEAPSMRQTLALIRILSGVGKSVTDKMHARDIAKVGEALGPLLVAAMGASGK